MNHRTRKLLMKQKALHLKDKIDCKERLMTAANNRNNLKTNRKATNKKTSCIDLFKLQTKKIAHKMT